MNLQILPLAITMMAGPQIMSALMLTTSKRPVVNSLTFVGGVALTASVGVFLYSLIGSVIDQFISLGSGSEPSTAAKVIQLILVALLVFLSVKSYRGRATSAQPKWMGSLMEASPRRAFVMATDLIFLMPTDIVTMLTVGINLTSNNLPFSAAIPFLLLTTLIAALPLIIYLLFYRRAKTFMPKVRDWMQSNSWAINIAVYLLFIYLVLGA